MHGFEDKFLFKNKNPGLLHTLEKSGSFKFDWKIRARSGILGILSKIMEKSGSFRKFKAWSNYHANFKTKLLSILSYIRHIKWFISFYH